MSFQIGDKVRVVKSLLYTGQTGRVSPISTDPDDFWAHYVTLDDLKNGDGTPRVIGVEESQLVPEYDLKVTCEAVPVQIEGWVNGKYVYFRARHGRWQFNIADVEEEIFETTTRANGFCEEFITVDTSMTLVRALLDAYYKDRL